MSVKHPPQHLHEPSLPQTLDLKLIPQPTIDHHTVDIVKLLEAKFKQKLDLYEKLGKSCPSFASFEIACCENKGAQFFPPATYHIYNMAELFSAWSENMNNLTKRKKSEKHWQAGLKKWLDGQWRKDKKAFDLTLKDAKIGEANQIRELISQLFDIQYEIKNCIKAPEVTHHHHHYYCKCGSPSVAQMDQMNMQLLQQGNSGEVHSHYIHYIEENTPNTMMNIPTTMDPPSTKVKMEETEERDFMDDETEYDANSGSSYEDEPSTQIYQHLDDKSQDHKLLTESEQEEIIQEQHQHHMQQQMQQKQIHHQQQMQHQHQQQMHQQMQHQMQHQQMQHQIPQQIPQQINPVDHQPNQNQLFHIDWPFLQDINLPEVQWPPQFEVNLPEVQWPPQFPNVQWPPQFEVNLNQQWTEITNSITKVFKKDK